MKILRINLLAYAFIHSTSFTELQVESFIKRNSSMCFGTPVHISQNVRIMWKSMADLYLHWPHNYGRRDIFIRNRVKEYIINAND